MDVSSIVKYVRLSPSKARDMARQVQGLPLADALKIADFRKKKAGFFIGKALKSGMANAEKNAKLLVDELWVKKAVIDDGPRLKRSIPRARGSVSPILKRTCHIRIILTDDEHPGGRKRRRNAR